MVPFLHLLLPLVSHVYSPQEVDISIKNTWRILKAFLYPGMCGIKNLFSKAIVRYRARGSRDTVHSKSHKSDSTVVAKVSLLQLKGLKFVALNIKCVITAQWKLIPDAFRALHLASEGGETPSSSLKLLAGRLHIDFCSYLSTKNWYYKPRKLPDLAIIV